MLANIPNLITGLRIFLVPIILLFLQKKYFCYALYFFVIAGLTDWLDGFLARKIGSESNFGKYFDPVADKILIISVYVFAFYSNWLDPFIVWVVIGRDIIIILGIIIAKIMQLKLEIKPILISKINTFLQILLICFLLVKLAYFNTNASETKLFIVAYNLLMIATFITTIWSGFSYVIIFYEFFSKRSKI